MDELSKGLSISYSGTDRNAILSAFLKQMKIWDVAMPNQEPLILDFGLGRFSETGLIEYWIVNEINAGYCAKYLFLFDQQTCPQHRHVKKTETFFVVKGVIEVDYSGTKFQMKAGDTLLVEPHKYHTIKGIGPSLFLEVSTPCLIDDNYFENTAIPIGGNFRKQ